VGRFYPVAGEIFHSREEFYDIIDHILTQIAANSLAAGIRSRHPREVRE